MDHSERPEGHDTVVSKGPCPKCGSKDNNVLYADGHSHCFSQGCGYFKKADGSKHEGGFSKVTDLIVPKPDLNPFERLSKRRIERDTLKKYGVFVAPFKGGTVQVYPYYSQQGELVAQKLRMADKSFPVLKDEGYPGSLSKCQLFGRHVYGDRYDRQVVITEGELDALSIAQAMDFKQAVVSVNTGADGAAACLKANYLWLDRFEDIVLWLDDDAPGREAAEECAKLFKVGKVRIVSNTGFKDASEVLQADKPGDIRTALYAAAKWRPKGIVNAADNPEDVCAPTADDSAFSFEWPWPEVTATLGPILPGQLCFHVAGTGIGKSTAVAHIAFHVMAQGGKVGYLSFEGTRREIKLALLTVHSGKRVDIEQLPDEDMKRLHANAFGSGLMELFDPETAEWTLDALEGYVRYLVKGLDCVMVVIDPLSTIVAMLEGAVDERRALDKIGMGMSKSAKELGVHVQISHHLTRPDGISHEEGAPTSINEVRGSGGLANSATFVIGHERNQQAEGDDWMLTQLRSLKNRPRSKTGPMVVLEYSMDTGRLSHTTKKFPPPGKPGGGKGERSKGFAPVGQDSDY